MLTALDGSGRSLDSATVEDLLHASEHFEEDDLELIDPARSLEGRRSPGSGNADSVRSQIAEIRDITARWIQ
jgi:argininosuccinate lyase